MATQPHNALATARNCLHSGQCSFRRLHMQQRVACQRSTACTAQRAHLHAVHTELPAVLPQQGRRRVPYIRVLLGIDGQP